MTATRHPTAVIEPGAKLGAGVVVGPFCHIGPHVEIGDDAVLQSHVVVSGRTHIGGGARVFPFASIGCPSQDMKDALSEAALEIGESCIIREGVTINTGARVTRIGARCALLAYAHIAHDCRLGDAVVLSNNVLLGGHVEIGDHAMIGGGTAVHQFVRIGAHAFVGGMSGVEGDVIPYAIASGNRAHLFGLNLVGLKRRGFDEARISKLRSAYDRLFNRDDARVRRERIAALVEEDATDADLAVLTAFLGAASTRPLCAPRVKGGA